MQEIVRNRTKYVFMITLQELPGDCSRKIDYAISPGDSVDRRSHPVLAAALEAWVIDLLSIYGDAGD